MLSDLLEHKWVGILIGVIMWFAVSIIRIAVKQIEPNPFDILLGPLLASTELAQIALNTIFNATQNLNTTPTPLP
jgi:hypothetical protein